MMTNGVAVVCCVAMVAMEASVTWVASLDRPKFLYAEQGVVEAADLNDKTLLQLASGEINKYSDRSVVLVWLNSRDHVAPGDVNKTYHVAPYGFFAANTPRLRGRRECRVTKIGNDAVVEIRDGERPLRRLVLSGRDPLTVSVAGSDVRITRVLPVRMTLVDPRVAGLPPDKDKLTRLNIYAFASTSITAERCRAVLDHFYPRVPFYEVQVSLSDVPWFLNDVDYPMDWPFIDALRFPTRDEYFRSTTVVCKSKQHVRSCCAYNRSVVSCLYEATNDH